MGDIDLFFQLRAAWGRYNWKYWGAGKEQGKEEGVDSRRGVETLAVTMGGVGRGCEGSTECA